MYIYTVSSIDKRMVDAVVHVTMYICIYVYMYRYVYNSVKVCNTFHDGNIDDARQL